MWLIARSRSRFIVRARIELGNQPATAKPCVVFSSLRCVEHASAACWHSCFLAREPVALSERESQREPAHPGLLVPTCRSVFTARLDARFVKKKGEAKRNVATPDQARVALDWFRIAGSGPPATPSQQ
jgi:hypothetical protein